jgi:hypothetical protein
MARAKTGPDVVQLVVTDRSGTIIATHDVIRRQIRRDAVDRYTGAEVAVG